MSISCIFKPMGGVGYEFFDYIESRPSRVWESIDLEVNVNSLTFTAEYEVYHIEGNANFVGNWVSDAATWFVCNKGRLEILVPSGFYYYNRVPTPCNLKIKHTPTYVTCNETRYDFNLAQNTSVIPLWIFGSTPSNKGTKQYKYVKIYDGDTLIRDLIPAKRISDGWVGMYCRVGNKFYGGLNAESFLIGNYT